MTWLSKESDKMCLFCEMIKVEGVEVEPQPSNHVARIAILQSARKPPDEIRRLAFYEQCGFLLLQVKGFSLGCRQNASIKAQIVHATKPG